MEVKGLDSQILDLEMTLNISQAEPGVKEKRIEAKLRRCMMRGVRWPGPECGELLGLYDMFRSGAGVIRMLVSLRPIFTHGFLGLAVRFLAAGNDSHLLAVRRSSSAS
jgi:hypothetical protein